MKEASYLKKSVSGTIFDICNILFMCALMFVMIYPFWNQLVVSLNDATDAQRGGLYFWPRVFSLASYQFVFQTDDLLKATGWSLLRVVVGTVSQLACTGLLAYITSVRYFSFRRILRRMFLVSMYIGGGMIPTYLWYMKLGLIETFHVYWIPGLLAAYNMMIIASYIQGLPDSLAESARIDGARELTIYIRIILPLCVPVFAALAIMSAVGHWNAWFDIMIYNPSGRYDTLQMVLRSILLESTRLAELMKDGSTGSAEAKSLAAKVSSTTMRAATTMIVTIPIVCVYPFFQKYFIKGISVGAVKE